MAASKNLDWGLEKRVAWGLREKWEEKTVYEAVAEEAIGIEYDDQGGRFAEWANAGFVVRLVEVLVEKGVLEGEDLVRVLGPREWRIKES